MAKAVERLPEFCQAALNEFWHLYPEAAKVWLGHFGRRLQQVQGNVIEERVYIETWESKIPQAE